MWGRDAIVNHRQVMARNLTTRQAKHSYAIISYVCPKKKQGMWVQGTLLKNDQRKLFRVRAEVNFKPHMQEQDSRKKK